jgi:serine/threonine protein kinase
MVAEHPVSAALATPPPTLPSVTPAPRVKVEGNVAPEIGSGYRLLRRINRGSFGEVWRAEAPGGVEVAVKIIYGSVAETQAQRELQALELIKRLRHPFLVPIHAFWQLEDRLIVAMELADGSLRDAMDERRRVGEPGLPLEQLLLYVREAGEALDYIHDKRVLHRDIKPENILVLAGHAKVADFDLARVVEQSGRLSAASHCGTPAYTAPEVFWRGKVGTGSDLYSLAVTYAELRLHRPLFQTKSWFQLMHDHLQRLPELSPLLDPEQKVLRKALAKDPADRYGTCREFVQALERAVPR